MDRDAGTTRDVHCVNKTEAESARVEFEEEMLLRSESQTWRANIVASTCTASLVTCSRTCFLGTVARKGACEQMLITSHQSRQLINLSLLCAQ